MKATREHLRLRWDKGEEPTLREFREATEHLDPESKIFFSASGTRCFVRIEEPV